MRNPRIILCLFLLPLFQGIYAQNSTCSDEEPLIEDLNSITKCAIEEVKIPKNRHYKVRNRKRINIVVSSKSRRRMSSKTAISVNELKKEAALNDLKKQTALIGKLEVIKKESLINKLPFKTVDEKPLFSACKRVEKGLQGVCFNKELAKHIKRELKYPKRALWHRMEGRVLVQFIIDNQGEVANVQVRKSKNNSLLEKEAVRIINKLPNFVPGKVNGEPVYVNKGVPINFVLPKEYKIAKKKHKSLLEVLPLEDADVVAEFSTCKGNAGNDKMECFNKEMIKHIEANFKYPKSASEDGIEGKVTTTFVINEKGNISNIQVTGPKHGRVLEKAATRLLEKLPKFSPSKKNGKPIATKYSIPIHFKLTS